MSVPRCHLEPWQWREPQAVLSVQESHYLVRVLRLRAGDRLSIFDGCGREADAEILDTPAGKGQGKAAGPAELRVELRILATRTQPAPATGITLLQALPRAARMDWILEKATELGIAAIQPLVSERVVAADVGGRAEAKGERWRRIALAAARQCQTLWVPEIRPLGRFDDVVGALGQFDLVLFGCLTDAARSLRETLAGCRGRPLRRVALLIGPEGDFTARETAAALAGGATPVSFGPRILRVETAALFGLSVLLYELVDQESQRVRVGGPPARGGPDGAEI